LERFDEAEDAFRKAIELDPKFALPWYNLGILLKDLERFEEAEDAYRKAIELDPKDTDPWYNLGHLFLRNLGRFGDAENAYWKAIELDPKDTNPWNTLGILRRDFQKDRSRARLCFEKGLEIDSNDPFLLMNLGWLFKAEGDAAKSEDRLRRSLESFIEEIDQKKVPDDRELAYALDLALQLKDAENAQKCFELASHRASHFWASSKLLGALFCYHLVHQDAEKAEAWMGVKASLKGFFEMFEQIQQLYNLAGFRPEVVEEARNLVGELLDAPPELTERFKDVPIAEEFLVAYRRFAEGKSRGLGDPGDLPYLFNK
ncbi:tetratricopeptide repeat protein, partial [Candidatus Poribacteria bacterium]|nr:tetratricopeptide repeat protein [Candidatus Poribacteria bacterium]